MSAGGVLADLLLQVAERERLDPAAALLALVQELVAREQLEDCSPVVEALAGAEAAHVAGAWEWFDRDPEGFGPDELLERYGVVEGFLRPAVSVHRVHTSGGGAVWNVEVREPGSRAWIRVGDYELLERAVWAANVGARGFGWALMGPDQPPDPPVDDGDVPF